MADTFTTFNNSADDYPQQQEKNLQNSNYMFQTYGNKKMSVKDMFGNANQKNTQSGMETVGESRKGRK